MTSVRRWVLRAGLSMAAASALYVAYRVAAANLPPPVHSGAMAPPFVAVTLDTPPKPRTIADYHGSPVLLNVWATWCDPCREEMPSMQRLYDAYKDRGLRVVAVSIDDEGNESLIREFAAEHHLTFDILHDLKSEIMNGYQVRGVPQTFLISADGEIRSTHFVTDWASDANRKLVERVLLAPKGAP